MTYCAPWPPCALELSKSGKTVMQELIYRAGRRICTGRRLILGLGANDRAAKAFARLRGELFTACT